MRERLVAYLLNDLDPTERATLEAELAADTELQQELEKVRQCLAACEDDFVSPVEAPPPQLASRTCCFVGHAIQKSKALCREPGGATSLSESRDPLVRPARWSAYDKIVGIGVTLAIVALVLPSLQGARSDARHLRCESNLHRIGAAVMEVAYRHNESLPAINYGENAGVWVVWLKEKGVPDEELLDVLVCPDSELAERISSGCVKMSVPGRQEYLAASGAAREWMRQIMGGDYAFSMGYRDQQGNIRQVHLSANRNIPMFADAPSASIAGYQSANHGGCGQNVLFQDLHVKLIRHSKCQLSGDHLYLNAEGQPAAGCHADDIVLGASGVTPVTELISAK